ncbi:MAG: dihydropteroate synthase [Acidimicrobiia bacterium]
MPGLTLDRPAVMGIVNVTPDSFSDGGRYLDAARAVAHGLELVAAGADVLDVGGESTRPGAAPVGPEEEIRRVVPVIRGLTAGTDVPVSVDTMKAEVAAAALDAGATVVNDVSAGRADPAMLPLVARAGAGFIAMHMLGTPATMQDNPTYDDVVVEVCDFLERRLEEAVGAGVAGERLVADPGIGFGKTTEHNLELLRRLPELVDRLAPVPVLIGTSRKAFIGRILAGPDAPAAALPVDEREEGTLATVVWAFDHGAAMVRVHDVRPAAEAARLLADLAAATPTDPDREVSWRAQDPHKTKRG